MLVFGNNIFEVNSWTFVQCSIRYCSWAHYAHTWVFSICRRALTSFGKFSPSIHQLKPCLSFKFLLNKTSFGRPCTWAATLSSVNHCLHNADSKSYSYFSLLPLCTEICLHNYFTLVCISIPFTGTILLHNRSTKKGVNMNNLVQSIFETTSRLCNNMDLLYWEKWVCSNISPSQSSPLYISALSFSIQHVSVLVANKYEALYLEGWEKDEVQSTKKKSQILEVLTWGLFRVEAPLTQ